MFQVTPGYGTNFATYVKGGAHHQQVVTHTDRIRSTVIPATVGLNYSPEQLVGGELIVANLTRLPGETALLESITIAVADNPTTALSSLDLDVIFYKDAFLQTPVDRAPLSLEPDDLPQLLGLVQVRSSDFAHVGAHRFATVSPPPIGLMSGLGASSVRVVLLARSTISLSAADALTISFITLRD